MAALAWNVTIPSAQAQPEPVQRLRIVGGLADLNQYKRHEEPFWTRTLPQRSNGRITAEIVPFDRAGMRGQEMLRLMQLGAVPFGNALLTLAAAQDPELGAVDLSGLSPDMATLRRNVAAFRSHLEKRLRERWDIELLAIYVYPAQVTFCSRPFQTLSDLSGRRIRSSNAAQSDLIEALTAVPVQTPFAEIVSNLRSGAIECAITGTMSGNTIGLHEVTSHIHPAAISWGVGIFGANADAWAALPAATRTLLRNELAGLEREIWAGAERETGEGIACNTGGDGCQNGRRGRMTEVRSGPEDARRLREIFVSTVLPRWIERCGARCASVWNTTIGPAAGIEAAPPRR
ncbi:MAG: hypothetical protein RIS35_993 [Pseudomonadota bacterium]|jgi:TRAP-type C4-dicarboxylate transport system substrate-binding protein